MRQFGGTANPEPMLIKLCGRRRAEGQLMPGNVVGVRVRNEADFLPAGDVEGQPSAREKQSLIPMKHGCIVA